MTLPLALLGLSPVEIIGILVVALLSTAVGMAVAFRIASKGQAEPTPDASKFALAFQKTPNAPAPAAGVPAAGGTLVVETGESTMAMRVVPDTSPAPMPGFADVYKRIAAGQIKGHIMVVGGPDRGRGIEVNDRAVSIGRGKHHTLALNDPGVSTDQCEIVAEGGKIILRDLGSKNGTFVNAVRIEAKPHTLENCDIVTCGGTKILMTLPG